MTDINLGVGAANSASDAYEITNSLKLEADNSENLYRDLHASTSTTKFTHSMWVKRTELTNAQLLYMRGVAGNEGVLLRFSGESGYEHGLQIDIGASGTNARSVTTRKFRDPSAWYHIVLAVDTTQSTAANRRRLYVNGVEETVFGMSNLPSQNFAMEVSSAKHRYGAYNDTDNYAPFSGYIAECHYVDGSQLDATSFGEFDDDSGIWKPKQYTGSHGTGGHYLNFSDTSSAGADSSGNSHNFTDRNLSAADHATDSPTNNFCILNLLDQRPDTPAVLTEGGTVHLQDPGSGTGSIRGTFGVNSGKWYWEFKLSLHEGDSFYYLYGVSALEKTHARYPGQGDGGFSIGIYGQNGNAYFNGSNTAWETSGSGGDGDIIGIFLDLDNGTMKVQKNGTFIGNAYSNDIVATLTNASISANFNKLDYAAAFADGTSSTAYRTKYFVNFGGYCAYTISSGNSDANGYGNFEYSPNDGTYDYYSLCTKNLAEYG